MITHQDVSASSNRNREKVSFLSPFDILHLYHWFYLFSHPPFVFLVILHLCL